MQVRHRIPTIFNLSMVDVLCCALGCVILLWLINLREAKQRALSAGVTNKLLASTRALLDDTSREAAETRLRLTAAEQLAREKALKLDQARVQRDQLGGDLALARTRLADLDKQVAALSVQYVAAEKSLTELKSENAAAAERLAKLSREQRELTKDKAEASARLTTLEKLLQEKEALTSAAARQADELAAKLRAESDRFAKAATLEARAQALETDLDSRKRDLADARNMITLLTDEKKQLSDKAVRAQAAVENRFAGMSLTGRRVVFLIDMSGSMELIDERTPAPDKWIGVRDTLAKIMRSLQNLEKFQVILFSDRVLYLLGSEDNWFDFDPKTSVDRVLAALASVKPRGNTNVHLGMQAAFRFRPAGMDTVYFFSDGLPNIGEGLSSDQLRTFTESQRGDVLSRHIRTVLLRDWNRQLANQPQVRINTLGFFYESPEVGAFLWALARENDGSFVGMSKP